MESHNIQDLLSFWHSQWSLLYVAWFYLYALHFLLFGKSGGNDSVIDLTITIVCLV